ncbi:MAG: FAD-dependent monooxygenase [Rhodospirillales bacterium]|jgi:salicylate hydroxylase
METHILIIGAGIGGLGAANALVRGGFKVTVIEQAKSLGEVGAGVQLGPNATRVFHSMGLLDDLLAQSVSPKAQIAFSFEDGKELRHVTFAEKLKQTFGFPYLHVYRPDLLNVLSNGCDIELKLESQVTTVLEEDDRAGVRLSSGEELWADAIIGCDGIHSVVRSYLHGPIPARFSGNMAWRGLCPGDVARELGIPRVSANWWGPGRHFVHYYVAGGRYLNWVGIAPHDGSAIESWSAKGEITEALRDFSMFDKQVRSIITSTPSTMKWALHDRDPLPFWSKGRISLLGDAAHPMLPFMAQGAAQSIEDGYVLRRCLEDCEHVIEGLRRYEQNRLERTAWVQQGSRKNETLFHLSDPKEVAARNSRLQAEVDTNIQQVQPDQSRLFGYDPVNDPLSN